MFDSRIVPLLITTLSPTTEKGPIVTSESIIADSEMTVLG